MKLAPTCFYKPPRKQILTKNVNDKKQRTPSAPSSPNTSFQEPTIRQLIAPIYVYAFLAIFPQLLLIMLRCFEHVVDGDISGQLF